MAKFQESLIKWDLLKTVGLIYLFTFSVKQISCEEYGEILDNPNTNVLESYVKVVDWNNAAERQGRQEEGIGGEDGDDGEDGGVIGQIGAAAGAAAAAIAGVTGSTTPPSTISQLQMVVAQVPQLINAITNFTLVTNPNRNRNETTMQMGPVPNIAGFLLQQGVNALNFFQRIAIQAQINREQERFQAGNATHQHFPGFQRNNSMSQSSTENAAQENATHSSSFVGSTTPPGSLPLDKLFIIRQPSRQPSAKPAGTAAASTQEPNSDKMASKPLNIYIIFHIHPNQTSNSSLAKVVLSNSSPLIKELLQGINSAISSMEGEGEQDEDSEYITPEPSTMRSKLTAATTTPPPPPKIFVQKFPANKNISRDQVAVAPNSFFPGASGKVTDSGKIKSSGNSGDRFTGRPVYWMNIYYPNGLLAKITMRAPEDNPDSSREEEEGQIIIDV